MIEPAPGKYCGSCTSCCKMPALDELQKPPGIYCSHCKIGVGCQIYSDRPKPCRTFMCGWIYNPDMGPELKPENCHVLIFELADKRAVVAQTDPDRPDAWRAPNVLNFLRQTAKEVPSDWIVVAACLDKTWRIAEHAIFSQAGDINWFVGHRTTDVWRFALATTEHQGFGVFHISPAVGRSAGRADLQGS
jgi:hypothetical protein